MGLLDALFSADPNQAGQTALAAGLLAGRGTFNQALGGGLLNAQNVAEQMRQEEIRRKFMQMQIAEAERQQREADQIRLLGQKYYKGSPSVQGNQAVLAATGGIAPTTANAGIQRQNSGFDWPGFAGELSSIDPLKAIALQQALGKETPYAKVNPSEYTAESMAKFDATGRYADLVPVRKKEVVDLGGVKRVIDPYAATAGTDLPVTSSPDTQARLAWDQYQWANPSAYQRSELGIRRGELANTGLRTQYETGAGVTGAPGITLLPAPGTPKPKAASEPSPEPSKTVPLVDSPLLPPREKAALLTAKPQEQAITEGALRVSERIANVAKELKNHKGLPGILGYVGHYSPDVTEAAHGARALQQTLMAELGINALNEMRQASKSGAGLGRTTDAMLNMLQQSVAALDPHLSPEAYKIGLQNVINQAKATQDTLKNKYQSTYGDLSYTSPDYLTQGNVLGVSADAIDEELNRRKRKRLGQ